MKFPSDLRFSFARALRRSLLTLALALPFGIGVALADTTVDFDIGPQPLESALKAFMAQSDVNLLYPPHRVRGLFTDGVKGAFEPGDALRNLLSGTGIGIERRGDAYLLVNGETASGEHKLFPAVTVTATRTKREVFDVPASVSVVTAEEIEKQPVIRPIELLHTLPGVDMGYKSSLAMPNVPIIRGAGLSSVGSTTQLLLNGMVTEPIGQPSRNYWYPINLSNIERIEVVRGPASVLYGPSAMGGVVNIITKRGSGEPYAYGRVGGGSHAAYALSAGAGGSFNDFDLQLNARTYETDGFKPYPETPSPWTGFYPSGYADLEGRSSEERQYDARVTWWLNDDSDLSFGIQHYENEGEWLGGHPNYRADNRGETYDIAFRTLFPGGQELNVKLLYVDTVYRQTWDDIAIGSLDEAQHDREDRNTYSADIQFDLHPVDGNTLTLGVVYSHDEVQYDTFLPNGAPNTSRRNKSSQYGALIQDEHRFDRLTVTAGVRYDVYKFYDDARNGVAYANSDDDVVTPRLGLNYKLAEGLALYGSAGTAYIPAPNSAKYRDSGGTWLDNPDLKPETAVSYEAGVKFAMPDDRLTGSLALYHSTYTDRISAISVGANRQYQNIGEIEAVGAELELNGRFAGFWQPFFNYTYTDAEITKNPSNAAWEGNTPSYVADHKANIGLTYDNPSLFTAYVVGRYMGDRYFSSSNSDSSTAPSHFIIDLKLSKGLKVGGVNLTASASVNNLFDSDEYGFNYEILDGRNYWLELGAEL